MKKYEYCLMKERDLFVDIVFLDGRAKKKEELDLIKSQYGSGDHAFMKLGNQGWELVSSALDWDSDGIFWRRHYFKRPIEDSPS